VQLSGFKSIKSMDLELRRLNVLIGANGAGKTNLISYFKMLNAMTRGPTGGLQNYITSVGQARSLLHYGPKQTNLIQSKLEFETDGRVSIYFQRLFHAAGDKLAFDQEFLHPDANERDKTLTIINGGLETRIIEQANKGDETSKTIFHLLRGCRVYHFHDTSPTARVRGYCYVGDNHTLLEDAGNLAAFLLRLRDENGTSSYQRIVATIRLVAPFFDDFDLVPIGPNKTDVILNWKEIGSDLVFGPYQLSDGTLRAMCLITLLMQPEDQLPDMIIVDEPELGLHPYALNVIASLFKTVSHHAQVLISTQSSSFLDNFDAEDVIIVNREGKESQFVRPDAAKIDAWLEDYSLGEVWEKNVIAGGPH
jgi:predicted ATPase